MVEENLEAVGMPEAASVKMYKIKEHFWNLNDKFKIENVNNPHDYYMVNSKILSWGDDIKIRDPQGKLVCRIKQRYWQTVMPRHVILKPKKGVEYSALDTKAQAKEENMDAVATLQYKFTLTPNFDMFLHIPKPDGSGELIMDEANPLKIKGGILEHEFSITSGEEKHVVCQASKHFFKFNDYYVVKVLDTEDIAVTLAACMVVDQVCHDKW